MSEGRILFLYENEAPFVHADLSILREHFEVNAMNCSSGSTFRRLYRALLHADLSFSWFALGYAARAVLLGRMFGRPSVLVAGGWDVVAMPEIGYGAARGRVGRARSRFVLRSADSLLTFSKWSRDAIHELSGREAEVVPLGVDVERFRPGVTKESIAVTVGNVTWENLTRKGLATFVRAAAELPDIRFIVAGRQEPRAAAELRAMSPPNVEMPGWVSDRDLRALLGRAKVYAQLSYSEGFGLALAEGMASGCVPVVTRRGSLPEVAGDIGFYAPYGDPTATASVIREALSSDRGAEGRHRIGRLFSLDRRRSHILALVENLVRR